MLSMGAFFFFFFGHTLDHDGGVALQVLVDHHTAQTPVILYVLHIRCSCGPILDTNGHL